MHTTDAFEAEKVYEVTFYTSLHTGRTATRKLRYGHSLVMDGVTRIHYFFPLRSGSRVGLAPNEIVTAGRVE